MLVNLIHFSITCYVICVAVTTAQEPSSNEVRLFVYLIRYYTMDDDYLKRCDNVNLAKCGFGMTISLKETMDSSFVKIYKRNKSSYYTVINFDTDRINENPMEIPLSKYPKQLFVNISLGYYKDNGIYNEKQFEKMIERLPYTSATKQYNKTIFSTESSDSLTELKYKIWLRCEAGFYGFDCSRKCVAQNGVTFCTDQGDEVCLLKNKGGFPPCEDAQTTTSASSTITTTSTRTTLTTSFMSLTKKSTTVLSTTTVTPKTTIQTSNNTTSKAVVNNVTLQNNNNVATVKPFIEAAESTQSVPLQSSGIFELTINNKVILFFAAIFLLGFITVFIMIVLSSKLAKERASHNVTRCMSELYQENEAYRRMQDETLSYKLSCLDQYKTTAEDTVGSIYEPLRRIGPPRLEEDERIYAVPQNPAPRYHMFTLPLDRPQSQSHSSRPSGCKPQQHYRPRSMEY